MHKLKLFCIIFVLFLSILGCHADRGQLENSNLHGEGQQQDEQDKIIPSYTTIYEAIKNRELEKAIVLLQQALKGDKDSDFTQRDNQGRSLLHLAIVNTDPSQEAWYREIVSLLIKLKQDVNARDNEANTPLHMAASKGLFFVAEELVKNGANVYTENDYGKIPLHYAVEGENIEVVRLLIDRNKTGRTTPLLFAIRHGFDKIAIYLIKQGANVNSTNSHLLLHKAIDACYLGRKDAYIAIIRYLISLGVGINEADGLGDTPLHLAIKKLHILGFQEVVNLLIGAGADIYAVNKAGNTPFFYMKPYIREVLL